MAEKIEGPVAARREFLKLASLGTVAAGTALLVQGEATEAAKAEPERTSGYRETAHVKAFYDSTRF